MVLILALLISFPGSRRPHFGKLCFQEDTHKLELKSKTDEEGTVGNEKTKRIIDLKGRKLFNYFVIMFTGWFIRVLGRFCFFEQSTLRN